jgi:hypothetical protein
VHHFFQLAHTLAHALHNLPTASQNRLNTAASLHNSPPRHLWRPHGGYTGSSPATTEAPPPVASDNFVSSVFSPRSLRLTFELSRFQYPLSNQQPLAHAVGGEPFSHQLQACAQSTACVLSFVRRGERRYFILFVCLFWCLSSLSDSISKDFD